ncbi:MAG TPA: hypothetical protein VEV41_28590 [Terriglobales bacterium]|nr:hypothetical protein [Terriglobales bacterium]
MKKALNLAAILLLLAIVAAAQTIPPGTKITIRTSSAISSATAKPGEAFEGTLARDLVIGGKTIAKAGAPVKGKVTLAKSSGRLHAPGQLSLRLTSVENMPVSTTAYHVKGKSHTKGNVEKIGGGAAAGALIGGLAGGGKGAGIGALAGGAAGTGVAAYTGKEEAVVPAEAAITFTATGRAKAAAKTRKRK